MAHQLTVRAVIYDAQERKLLCQMLRSRKNDTWYLPGGKVDEGESIEAALIREIQEECGVNAIIGRLLYVNQYYDGVNHVTAFIYSVVNVTDFKHIDLKRTTHGTKEISQVAFVSQSSMIVPRSISELDLDVYCSRVLPVFIDYEK